MLLRQMYCPRTDELIEVEMLSDATGDRINACHKGDVRVLACCHERGCIRLLEDRPLVQLLWPEAGVARRQARPLASWGRLIPA
jgi:hypothetical protein